MNVALTNHPEWTGDWQMPEGIQQAEIDPTTGQLAKAEDPNKSGEIFINGTSPATASGDMADQTTQEPTDQIDGDQQDKNSDLEPATLPDASPEPPRAKPTPKTESRKNLRDVYDGDSTERLQGTITLDIDPTTGLIAVDSCPVIRTKTFIIGQEPKKYCGPEYHKKAQSSPAPRSRPPNR